MPSTDTLLTFALASYALIVIPGPAVLYIVNRSVSHGRGVGLSAMAGVELGAMVHVMAACLGLSAVLSASATAFNTVKWAGVAYLLYVGIQTLRHPPSVAAATGLSVSRRTSFAQGVVVNILNPKVALFFLSFLPQFIDPGRGRAGVQAFVLGCLFVAIGAVSDSLYALVASGLRTALLRGRIMPFVQRWVAGSVFIGLGLLAATSGHARARQR